MGRIMAFDYGTKRIGIAVSDPLKIIANPLDTVHPKDIYIYVERYLQNESVERFVIGEPKKLNNSPSDIMPHVKGFANQLQKKFPNILISWIDERYTSKMASNAIAQSGLTKKKREQKSLIDQTSATIILQSFMSSIEF